MEGKPLRTELNNATNKWGRLKHCRPKEHGTEEIKSEKEES